MSLAEQVLDACRTKRLTIATAESCTGGMVAVALTDVAGSSDVFLAGFVSYSNTAKQELLGVSGETLSQFGAVSEQVVREMAAGALRRSKASFAVAITGIAGPGGSEHKPEGLVCFGLTQEGQDPISETVDFGALGRTKVRQAATDHALALLMQAIERH